MLLQAKFNYELSVGVGEECIQHSNGALSISFPAIYVEFSTQRHTLGHAVFPFLAQSNYQIKILAPQKQRSTLFYPLLLLITLSHSFFFPSQRAGTASELLLNDPHEKCMRFFIESGI